ncbi:Group 1 truncated hemoglobin glbN [Tetrabaena socialis]|uniref:Group 1 truncated hemoglobin glbN n=1 Tax=Tetrabaena socialis TaxID=47790 RepID=A0A2J8AG44_9CHLO|nr:Group 1 truncated hemoglobin glbN [Tetrabaena socialis]|eukprot:PNH11487.1 Group 1 truncated hemoglobin glbN [Tetrabaena socialis]
MAPDSTQAGTAPTLYDRLGGAAAVDAAVDIFYGKLMADAVIAPFFEGIDMKKQRRKQVAFMSYVFGGADGYQGRDLGIAHKRLILEKGLNEGHFDMVANHLAETLRSLNVPTDLLNEAMAVVETARPAIFGQSRRPSVPISRSAAASSRNHQRATSMAPDSTQAGTAPTLYDRLGGAAAVDAAVDIFYGKLMADAVIAPFFGH